MPSMSSSSPATTAATGSTKPQDVQKEAKPWHVVFDLDGTLLDTLEDIATAANRAMKDFNPNARQFELLEVRKLIGDGARILMQRMFTASEKRSPTKDEMDKCHRLFLERYAETLLVRTRPYPKVMENLLRLQNEAPTALLIICTNKPQDLARELVEKTELCKVFPRLAVTGAIVGSPQKPDPNHVLRAVDEFVRGAMLDPERTIIVGDGANDILAAHELSCRSIAVTYGFSDASVLHALQPTIVVDDFDDVAKHVIAWMKE